MGGAIVEGYGPNLRIKVRETKSNPQMSGWDDHFWRIFNREGNELSVEQIPNPYKSVPAFEKMMQEKNKVK